MITVVAGARPNFVKVAPILRELARRGVAHEFIHTGQHSGDLDLCKEFAMPLPALWLQLGGLSSREYLDAISSMLVQAWAPPVTRRAVVVVGDVTSTLAATLAAVAHGIPVVHVEAGLRSGDWTMPEERNRVIVDRVCDLALCSERGAHERCVRETFNEVPEVRRRPCSLCVGNVMIDSLRWAEAEGGVYWRPPHAYAVVTLHRPSNVDDEDAWARCQLAITAIRDRGLGVVLVKHPRAPLPANPISHAPLAVVPPQPYGCMIGLLKHATLVATDSGGVQEETTALGVPCLTLRENTERPITVTEGTNTVVGLDPDLIGDEVDTILAGFGKRGTIPEGWDGHAASRIVDAIVRRYL